MYIVLSIFVCYAIGIISYEYNFFYYYFLLIFVVLLYNTIKSKKFIYNIVIISFIILSFINCNYNSKSILVQYIGEEVNIVAKVKNANYTSNEKTNFNSYNATIVKINSNKLHTNEKTIIYLDKSQKLDINSIINIKGNVSDVSFGKNFMLFNYKSYLRAKKIYGTVFCTSKPIIIEQNYSLFNRITNDFKLYTENLFTQNLSKQNSEIILSMILGDVDYIDDGLYENIKRMGLAHIFAVSGLHIGLLYGALLYVLRLIGFYKKTSWIITWSLLWIYGFLIGLPVSIMRTLVMFTFLFGSQLIYRKYSSLNAISLAALILTIINPFWIFDVGFLLSFSAAFSIIIFSRNIQKNIKTKNTFLKTIYMYLFLQLFTCPIVIYFFNYLPLLGIMYNLLLIPLFTVVLICSFVFLLFNNIFTYTLVVPFKLFDYFLYSLRYIINFTENINFNGIVLATPSIYEIISIYLAIFYIIYFYKTNLQIYIKFGYLIIISFYMITYIIVPITDKSLYFSIIDVGQGMFSTVHYQQYDFIFDCGSTSNKDLGDYVAVPYFIKRGINEIDGVFISHWDSDHYSGIYGLINCNYINMKKIFSSSNNEDINCDIITLKKDDYIKIDNNLEIKILSPLDNIVINDKNNSSLVIQLNFNKFKILLPGDIEAETEQKIINDIVKSDILILPHHGSKTSSTENFVNIVSPKFAVISYGENNYGIPSDEVLDRYNHFNSNIISTFYNGEINFVLKDDNLYYNTYTGKKSDNYYELYFIWLLPKLFLFEIFILLIIIYYIKKRGEIWVIKFFRI